jgi:hypothetical protein
MKYLLYVNIYKHGDGANVFMLYLGSVFTAAHSHKTLQIYNVNKETTMLTNRGKKTAHYSV